MTWGTTSSANSYAVYQLISCFCAVILTILLSLDVWKAFKRKAHWIPGEVLVLTALTIQMLSFLENLNLVNSKGKVQGKEQMVLLVVDQLLLDTRRVMMCVFIAYLLPGVVGWCLRTVWGDTGALTLCVNFHLVYEVYSLKNILKEVEETSSKCLDWKRRYREWVIVSHFTAMTAIILLAVLLSSAVMAGKSIRKIMSQKVPLALSCCCNSLEERKCKNIEDHVLKSWIVVRASQPDYIMARSVLSAFAGLIVTVCLLLFVVKLIHVPSTLPYCQIEEQTTEVNEFQFDPRLRTTTYVIQFAFVAVASIVVLFRWFTAVLYFPRDPAHLLYFEDFWTRSLVEVKEDLHAQLTGRLFREKRLSERRPVESIIANLVTAVRLHLLLLTMGLWLQTLMVSLSKASWYLSHILFRMIRPFVMKCQNIALLSGLESDQFSKYKEALEIIRMPGEMPHSLWIANESAFNKAHNHMIQGFGKGKSSSVELINLMKHKIGPPEDQAPTFLEEKKYLKEVGRKSWKMRAVSLIHLMIYVYDGTNSNLVNDAIQAYSQAWHFMDIVDSSDVGANLVSLAADKELDTLENIWKKHLKIQSLENPDHNQSKESLSNKLLDQKIRNPLRQHMEQLYREERARDIENQRNWCVDNLHDSKDWMMVAAKISLYKTWKTVDLNSNSGNALHNLRCLLANVVVHCMENELENALRENCNKWAEDMKEQEIFNAAFIAGKAKGVWDQIIEANNAARDRVEVVEGEVKEVVQGQVEAEEGEGTDAVDRQVEGKTDNTVCDRVEGIENKGHGTVRDPVEAIEAKCNEPAHNQVSSPYAEIIEVEEAGENNCL